MKRCPQCGRDYNDDSLSFCLDDGSDLLFGPSSDEPATAILSDAPTRQQAGKTDPTEFARPGSPVPLSAAPRTFDKRSLIAVVALALIALGGFWGYRYMSTTASKPVNSIAVLPFENRSSNTDTDYLSDGLTDSLIFRLSQLPDLKVSPTSSVMRYHGASVDIPQIAKELDTALKQGETTDTGGILSRMKSIFRR